MTILITTVLNEVEADLVLSDGTVKNKLLLSPQNYMI